MKSIEFMKVSRILTILAFSITISACSSSVRFSNSANASNSDRPSKKTIHSDNIIDDRTKLSKDNQDFDNNPENLVFRGKASYYSDEFDGRQTANGEIYDSDLLTAAHRTIAFGTIIKVTNLKNGKEVIVKINDRGPFKGDRIIDLSRAAAEQLGMIKDGVIDVECEILSD